MEPISYEEVFAWRDICELLERYNGGPLDSDFIHSKVPNSEALVGYDRTRRQLLWDTHKIQLIRFVDYGRKEKGWRLKSNWEFKIDYLERIYVLGQDPTTLRRLWHEDYLRSKANQVERERLEKLERNFRGIILSLHWFKNYVDMLVDLYPYRVRNLREMISEARAVLKEIQFAQSGPAVMAIRPVVQSSQVEPEPDAAVLGGNHASSN